MSKAYKPTIGADFHSKKVEIEVNNEIKTVTLQVKFSIPKLRTLDLGHSRVGALSKFRGGLL